MLIEGLSFGALACGMLSNIATDGVRQSASDAISAIKATNLPKNHHIQRGVRQAFLRTCVYQLRRYEELLEAEPHESPARDGISRAFAARKHLQWPCFKARWTAVPVMIDGSQMDAIGASMDAILSGDSTSLSESELRGFLTDAAISEIVSVSSWEACPPELYAQMHHETEGWFPVFSANIAHVIKTNEKFRTLLQSLVMRGIEVGQKELGEHVDFALGFHALAHSELLAKIDQLQEKIEAGNIPPTQDDRLLVELSQRDRDFEQILRDLPFGRRSVGTSAAEGVAAVIKHLTEFFSGRTADLININTFVDQRMAGRNNGLLIMTAPAGFGKSALAAVWCESNTSDRRYIARHFCNAAGGGIATTDPKMALDHLLVQVAEAYGVDVDLSSSESALLELLKTAPPNNRQVIIWLDGVDEAQGEFPPFLPQQLGERVCIVISARAPPNSTPHYLLPWTTGLIAEAYQAPRFGLERLTENDVEELVTDYFNAADLHMPDALPGQIYIASDKGYALFSRVMAEDAAKAIAAGEIVDLGEAPLSLQGYALSQMKKLKGLSQWSDIEPIFNLLCVAREALEMPLLRNLSTASASNYDGWDYQLRRWLWVTEPSDRKSPPTISFAHPKLAMVFREAIGWQSEETINSLVNHLKAPPAKLERYALRHLPFHLIETGEIQTVAELLMDEAFVDQRFERLGDQIAIDSMTADWRYYSQIKHNKSK